MAVAVVAVEGLRPRMGLGQAAGAKPDAKQDLLKATPYDRITLEDNLTITVEPISPRPLPPYDREKDKAARRKVDAKTAEGNVLLDKQKKKKEEPQLNEIVVHRIDGEPGDYKIRRFHIKNIEYFEDMLLAEAERLTLARDYTKAFEYLMLITSRNPKWKGLDDAVNRLLFEEANAAILLDRDSIRGLRLLRELYDRKPDYPELRDRLASAFNGRIEGALEAEAYADGRRTLHDLDQLTPNHLVVREAKRKFRARAQAQLDRAARLRGGERLDAITAALRIWPELEGADAMFREAFAELPTLDVGVIDVSHPVGPWVRTPSDARISRLVYVPLLARDSEDAVRGRLNGQLASEMLTADLGLRLTVTLREAYAWSDGSRAVSSVDVVRSLSDRTVPSSPNFNARWAEMLERVEATDQRQVSIRLTRAPLKPEAWLVGPIGPAHTGRDGHAASADGVRRPVGDGPYRYDSGNAGTTSFVAVAEPGKPGAPKIRRIRELRRSGADESILALLHGEITLLAHVPPDRIAELKRDETIQIGKYDRPSVHVIALDGRAGPLHNRTLRRGLSYAIDRTTLLEEAVLRRPVDEANGPADGVFPKDSYANATDVDSLGHDPLLAKMLVAAGRKELGGDAIKLTLEYPARPEARASIGRIAEALREAGVQIKTLERPETQLEDELRAGRKFDLAYRVLRTNEPVTDAGPLLCPGYDAPPLADGLAALASPRMLQLLLQLEQTPDYPTARTLAVQIDREIRDELPVIPLWQLEENYAWRSRLKGPKEQADILYHDVATWEIEPWYAKDPW